MYICTIIIKHIIMKVIGKKVLGSVVAVLEALANYEQN